MTFWIRESDQSQLHVDRIQVELWIRVLTIAWHHGWEPRRVLEAGETNDLFSDYCKSGPVAVEDARKLSDALASAANDPSIEKTPALEKAMNTLVRLRDGFVIDRVD